MVPIYDKWITEIQHMIYFLKEQSVPLVIVVVYDTFLLNRLTAAGEYDYLDS